MPFRWSLYPARLLTALDFSFPFPIPFFRKDALPVLRGADFGAPGIGQVPFKPENLCLYVILRDGCMYAKRPQLQWDELYMRS